MTTIPTPRPLPIPWISLLFVLFLAAACGGGGGGETGTTAPPSSASDSNLSAPLASGTSGTTTVETVVETTGGTPQSALSGSETTSGLTEETDRSVGTARTEETITTQVEGAPQIVSEPDLYAAAGEIYTYQLEADGESPITFTLDTAPEGALLDETGLLTWETSEEDIGIHAFVVVATNPLGRDEQRFFVTVDLPPVITTRELPELATVGVPYTFQMLAEGPGTIEWFLPLAPPNAFIDLNTGSLEWTPQNDQEGENEITIEARSEFGSDFVTATILVGRAPTIVGDPRTTVEAGQTFHYEPRITGTPPFRWMLGEHPSGMTIDAATGETIWPTTSDDIGNHTVEILVENDFGGDAQRFNLAVLPVVESPPSITSTPPETATVGVRYEYQATAEGAKPITWELIVAPNGMTVDERSGLVTWTPEIAGVEFAILRATNDFGSDEQEFLITVLDGG